MYFFINLFFCGEVENYDRAQTICNVCMLLLQMYTAIKYTASESENNDRKKLIALIRRRSVVSRIDPRHIRRSSKTLLTEI